MVGVVVTGGGSGIGKAVCYEFAKEGYGVVIADINSTQAEETAKQINGAFPGKCVVVHCDVTNESHLQNAVDECKKQFGRVDIFCNNAGISEEAGGFDNSEKPATKSADLIIKINLLGVVLGTHVAIKAMREDGKGGVIINTASMGGILPIPLGPIYSATKAAVIQFTRSLSYLEHQGIRVKAICPTYTLTPLITSEGESRLSQMKQEIGGKFLTAEQVAEGFKTLANDKSSEQLMSVTVRKGCQFFTPKVAVKSSL